MNDTPLTLLEFAMLVEQLGGGEVVEIDRASVWLLTPRDWVTMDANNDVELYTRTRSNGEPVWQVYSVRRKP